jgi:hypothetical protein
MTAVRTGRSRKGVKTSRELAQWLMDHPRDSNREVASWRGCSYARIGYLRRWATGGFHGSPFDKDHKPGEFHPPIPPLDLRLFT